MRLGRHNMFMEIARIVARRGTCPRLCVGAVVVINNRVVSMGYNGSLPGEPHCTDEGCIMRKGSCDRAIHAEVNALDYIPGSFKGKPISLYVTHSPCSFCADYLIEHEVKKVFFEHPYKDANPLLTLINNDIAVYRVMPNGYIVRGSDGEIVEAD